MKNESEKRESRECLDTEEESLCYIQTIAFLSKYRIAGLKVDVPRLFKTTFQELLLLSLLAFLTVLGDYVYTLFHDVKSQDCVCFIAAPLLFIGFLLLTKAYETKFLRFVCSYARFRYSSINAAYRVLQKFVILGVLLAITLIPPLVSTPAHLNSIPYMGVGIKGRGFAIPSRAILKLWHAFATKLMVSYAVITFCRLFMDMTIYSYKFITSPPPMENNEFQKLQAQNLEARDEDKNSNYANVFKTLEEDNRNPTTTTGNGNNNQNMEQLFL